ncbi:MAG TPA: oxygenase MpaB family protein [Sporichthya sp.]|nr:oxygenase MpaB family protein [Sporichthya sp.]
MSTEPRNLRERVGASLFARVAGPEGPARRERIMGTAGPRWFDEGSPIRQVHGDAAMFIGGLRALLLQSLHPLAMAGVAGHSGYRGDPWGRLQRTSTFLATTTFGTASDAQAAVDHVRSIHARVRGTAPDGRPYSADDPHLLQWVHVAEIDSFLRAHQRFGVRALDAEEADGYVADTAHIARALGVPDPPLTVTQLQACLDSYRAELHGTAEARAAARYLVFTPPLPVLARAPYAVLSANAVALLPSWARRALWLPRLPVADSTAVPLGGHALVRGIRWAMR